MGSKPKKRAASRTPSPVVGPREEVLRLITKGQLNEAVRRARVCLRDEPNDDNHRLLERAYLLRARQLLAGQMRESAREVAQHLRELGVTDPALVRDTVALWVAVGMVPEAKVLQEAAGSAEDQERFVRLAADQAMLHPEDPALSADLSEGARKVRVSLEVLTAGEEAKALESLHEIARSSPFADWRLFARGLAAFYRGAQDEARADWERLDPDRAAARIARHLLGAQAKGAAVASVPPALETHVFGEPITARMIQLRDFVAGEDWSEAMRLLGPLRTSLRRVEPALAERLTRVLYASVIDYAVALEFESATRFLADFTRFAEPLPLDPQWHRLWALAWSRVDSGIDQVDAYWRAYLEDLKTLPALSPEDRRTAQALVLNHLAADWKTEAEEPDLDPFDILDDDDVPDPKLARKRAIACLEESLRLCPSLLLTYQVLIELYRSWGDQKNTAKTAERLLKQFPEHYDALGLLASYYYEREEPEKALGYLKRARAIKPLDRRLVEFEWATHVALARQLSFQKRWEQARAEFAIAEQLMPRDALDFHFLARRAALEIKAGEAEHAEALIEQAKAGLAEPTPLWLALSIETARSKLPKQHIERFKQLWNADVKNACRGDTASELAKLLTAYVKAGVEYTNRAKHINDVLGYLRRSSKAKYQPDELRNACEFVMCFPKETKLLETLAHRGAGLAPNSPYFIYAESVAAMRKSLPSYRLLGIRDDLRKALAAAQKSAAEKDRALVSEIREVLSGVENRLSSSGPASFGPPGDLPLPPELRAMFESLCAMQGISPEEALEAIMSGMPFPKKPPSARPKPKKSSKRGKSSKS